MAILISGTVSAIGVIMKILNTLLTESGEVLQTESGEQLILE